MSEAKPEPLPEINDTWFFGHPKGLAVLFFAEMWERFSYYGMRALLILYLTKHWLYSDGESSVIYGAYTALVYITPVLGGYLADKFLGQRKAVVFGALLLTFGHMLMGIEGIGDRQAPESWSAATEAMGFLTGTIFYLNSFVDTDTAKNCFWLALAFIIVGSGFLKANISVIVGQLYPITDVRRDGAYTIFYMGINLGAALGSILCGWLGETYGWSYGFGAAGFGMLLGLVVFMWGKPLLYGRGESPDPEKLASKVSGIKFEWLLYLVGIAAVAICWWLVQNQKIVGWLLGIFGGILVLYVVFTAVVKLSPHERDRIFAALFLIFGSILFWALFEQAGSSLNLLTDRMVDRNIFGIDVKASMFQSINAIYIVLLAPVLAALWTWMGRKGIEPSTPAKFGMGMIQLGAGFLVLVFGAKAAGLGNLTPVIYIFLIYLLHTTGELCLSPVGLSAMNRLAPAHLASIIMGTWFFASATGNFAAGLIASASGAGKLEGGDKEMVPGSDEAVAYMTTMTDVYTKIGWAAVIVGVVVIVISPLVKKLMHLDTLGDEKAK